MSQEKRVALITGGARGIGRAIGLHLAESGWSVAVCFRSSEREAQETVEAIQHKGGKGLAVKADVSDPEGALGFVRDVEKTWGRIDALINCAGPYHRVPLLEETLEGWHAMFSNNLHPVFYLGRLVAPGMIERKWGRIITFSMANADQCVAQPQITAHYIAKAGVLILTRTLARVLAPHGITVNAISPGFIASGSAPVEELKTMEKKIPAGYIGSLDDAVAAAAFLLSDDAKYVHGANIHLSGAWGV